ncbi:MAG: sugar phosphate nucleotidyltransferase [Acidobacteriota bacterium]
MKVVLFCGGLGMRLREFSEDHVPKPMVKIGYRPILWHVMKYYAHFGFTDFILCLGYKADVIKNYFLTYNECLSNDFVLAAGGKQLQLLNSDIQDWRITFADTGTNSNIAQRLMAVEKYLEGEQVFLANYSDSLTDLWLPDLIGHFDKQDKIGCFLCVKPNLSYHFVTIRNRSVVADIRDITSSNIRINGGYFIFKKEIFRYIRGGDELVLEPFQRLIRKKQLSAFVYDGFWKSMDTFKDKQSLDDLYSSGAAPWELWKKTSLKAR